MTPFERDVAAVLLALESGDLLSYGEVAIEAGHPGAARAVGSFLANAESGAYPWWRVVTSTGRLVPGATDEQGRLLTAEGFDIVGDRVRPVN